MEFSTGIAGHGRKQQRASEKRSRSTLAQPRPVHEGGSRTMNTHIDKKLDRVVAWLRNQLDRSFAATLVLLTVDYTLDALWDLGYPV